MAHELYIKNGKAAMAYAGDDTPWHGLGQSLSDGASIETWKEEAGMDWEIKESPVIFNTPSGQKVYSDQKILYRGDTQEQLSIVGDNYKVVQPGEVLEFFRELVGLQGMKLSTAGVLFGGRRFWALAETGQAAQILGNDKIKGNLLLTTSCDGTMATSAMLVATRVVCNNTLRLALGEKSEVSARVTHRTEFDPYKLKQEMGLIDQAWDQFIGNVKQLAVQKLSEQDQYKFVYDLIKKPNLKAEDQPYTVSRDVANILNRAKQGMGQTGERTLWTTLNGITEFCDHESRARMKDRALWNSWFGNTANLKTKAYIKALEMV